VEFVSYSILSAVAMKIVPLFLWKSRSLLRVLIGLHFEGETLNIGSEALGAAELVEDGKVDEVEHIESVQLIEESAIEVDDVAEWVTGTCRCRDEEGLW
jgi:hypothetical protein